MTIEFAYTIGILSALFWIFPAIKNYKTRLFLYFLTMALTDPLSLTVNYLAILPGLSINVYLLFSLILIASLKDFFTAMKIYVGVLSPLLLFGLVALFLPIKIKYISMIANHICIAFIFISLLLSYVASTSKVKGFHIVLVFYELSLIVKVLFIVLNVNLGLSYFYTTSIFEMLIAVFFSIYKETDEKLLIDLRNV